MSVKASFASCKIITFGIEMRCPLCRVLVPVGELHFCSKQEESKPAPKRTRKLKA